MSRIYTLCLLISLTLSSCVTLPDLTPGGGGSTMTVIPVNQPFNINSYYGVSISIDYQGEHQGQIQFREGSFTMVMDEGSKVLINALSAALLPPNTANIPARFLNENEMVGRVDNALWGDMAMVIDRCLGWLNAECTPDMIDVCDGPLGLQEGACTFFNKYIPLKLQLNDGVHYGWLKISKDPFATVYPEKSMIHELAFSNEVGRHVRMGQR